MDGSKVYMKTAKGAEEIANRSGALSLMVRRILILADGKRPISELASWVRDGEIENVMGLLESQGFVQCVGGTSGFDAQAAPSKTGDAPTTQVPANTAEARMDSTLLPQSFEQMRARALKEVADRLGPDGDHLVEQIERSQSSSELRELVREAERLIAVFYKEVAAQDFVRALRQR